ncbi:DNA repair protein RecN [Salisediminibacterium halotolerans]|uniref:DNA repair protein RecN n=1 Tax=Salisediminibacterium halotolerans TaxID=517425 RepID=UPI000EAB68A5|nr:DNA repair protein RecN [Salisediminibacterium halotolerans]RLJ78067.1 DNA replication and repair protein RecN [Actinophytocola xinjiangensis]RPE88595.1 DNA replication and repair protein RecN [Salisediminibacterium halotolerans]TWG37044.1 DNA replication and repair protein RecN [Salisediminibacterium halotolerans]GEL06898.1 DNA repair protein RecN [Salisediminibacterium halotolerans]
MLIELSIRDFAIIDETTISFEDGLTVLTGETGAGKSIVIDAIGQLIGGRGSADYVRHGSKRAEIEGLFSINTEISPQLTQLLEDLGIPQDPEENSLILRRELTNQGKSICRVNGKLTTLGVLREIGQTLVDIHGQHEHQRLLQADKHLMFLDRFAEEEINGPKKEYDRLYRSFKQKKDQLKKLAENEQQNAQRLDLIRYQYDEITSAKLEPEEDDRLTEEKQRLDNSEDLFRSVEGAYEALYGDGKGLEWIMAAVNQLSEAEAIDPGLKTLSESISSNYYILEEGAFSLRDYAESIEFDAERLEMIEARLSEIHELKRKYGSSVKDILEYAASIEEEIDTLENREQRLHEWESELSSIAEDLKVEGQHLREIRKREAKRLEAAIEEQLQDLYMKDTVFRVSFNDEVSIDTSSQALLNDSPFHKDGIDEISFQVATNKGEPLKPLAKVASGGEISRMILALKSILSRHEGVTSLIFDEVDTGVSGRIAQAIAEKIHHISTASQVLCITHLPQVAAMADTHLFIAKGDADDRTTTTVNPLNQAEKSEEIGRMISGVEITDLTRKHAEELIEQASAMKNESFQRD